VAVIGESSAFDGEFVIVCFDGDGVTGTGILVGFVEGCDVNLCVGKLVEMRLFDEDEDVGAADRVSTSLGIGLTVVPSISLGVG